MIKRSENHEKHCMGVKPHIFISKYGLMVVVNDDKILKSVSVARERMNDNWGLDLSKRLSK